MLKLEVTDDYGFKQIYEFETHVSRVLFARNLMRHGVPIEQIKFL